MDMTGAIAINPKPFWWGANLLGSFVFGIGMVLAGGCASGITYRTGEGMVGAMTAVLGLATAGYFTAAGFLKPFKANLQAATTVSGADGSALTLHGILGMNYTTLALIIFIIAVIAWYIIAKQNKEECEADPGWGWLNTGILVGIVGILAFPLSAAAGRNYPLGITAGWINIVKVIFTGEAFNWLGLMIVGIIVGGLIAALISKEFKFRMPKPMVLAGTDLCRWFVNGIWRCHFRWLQYRSPAEWYSPAVSGIHSRWYIHCSGRLGCILCDVYSPPEKRRVNFSYPRVRGIRISRTYFLTLIKEILK